jgi:membrane protein required for colicin V production
VAAADWILVLVLLLSLIIGAWRGLVFEVLSLVGWVIAFLCAQWWGPAVGKLLPVTAGNAAVATAIGFVVVFIGVAFAAGLVSSLCRRLVTSVGLRPVDRTLGAAFGLLRGLLVLLAFAWVVEVTSLHENPWWHESAVAPLLRTGLEGMRPLLPESLAQFISWKKR